MPSQPSIFSPLIQQTESLTQLFLKHSIKKKKILEYQIATSDENFYLTEISWLTFKENVLLLPCTKLQL